MPERRADQRQAFTLIELLVVIAIIITLMALLLPAIQRVREAANRMWCANNLRQLAIATHNYAKDHHRFPPCETGGPNTASWVTLVLPYIEQQPVYALYNFSRGWDDPANQPAVSARIKLFICPSAPSDRDNRRGDLVFGLCDYSPIFDVDPRLIAMGLLDPWRGNPLGVISYQQGARLADVEDGLSNTILIAEDAGRPLLYQAGQHVGTTDVAGWASANALIPINLDGFSHDGVTQWGPCAVNCTNVHEVYSFHTRGANSVFADGHIQFLRSSLSIKIMAALVTRAGGEHVNIDEWD